MVWISRLALFGYIVGGWLLPASHFHAHGDHLACHHDPSQHAAAESEDAHAPHSCCDDHPHHDEAAEPSDQPESGGGPVRHVEAASPQLCGGLCALCSARSLCSTTLRCALTTSGYHDTPLQICMSEPFLVRDILAGAISSRGPPLIV